LFESEDIIIEIDKPQISVFILFNIISIIEMQDNEVFRLTFFHQETKYCEIYYLMFISKS